MYKKNVLTKEKTLSVFYTAAFEIPSAMLSFLRSELRVSRIHVEFADINAFGLVTVHERRFLFFKRRHYYIQLQRHTNWLCHLLHELAHVSLYEFHGPHGHDERFYRVNALLLEDYFYTLYLLARGKRVE